MKKIVLFAFLCLIMLCAEAAAAGREAIVNEKFAPVYEQKNENSKKLRTLTKGVKVQILESDGKWLLILHEEKSGWALRKDFRIIESGGSDDAVEPKINTDEAAPSGNEKIDKTIADDSPTELADGVSDKRRILHFGVKAGAAIASLSGDLTYNADKSRLGFAAGIFTTFKLTPNFGIQTEFQYIQKGATGDTPDGKVTVKLDYFEPELMFRGALPLNFGEAYLMAGPHLSFAYNQAVVLPNETHTLEDTKPIDYGLTFAAGFEYHLKNPKNETWLVLFVEGRCELGLTTIHDAAANQLDIKNNVIMIQFGVGF